MKSVEEKLWDYIDGTCTADEQQAISLLIQTDAAYEQKYQELLKLNQEFATMELDEPSMAFTYNVMKTIRTEQTQKPLKARINPYIIKGIAAFFMVIIVSCVIMLFTSVNWSVNNTPANTMALPDLKKYFNKSVLNAFLFFDTLLGLFFIDAYLRRRRFSKHV